VRIFKTTVFARWANKSQVTDAALRQAIHEVEAGIRKALDEGVLIEVDSDD
jgi:hypothetical protein